MPLSALQAILSIPPGRWAVGVSGGADSVALLCLLQSRGDLQMHVVHLNHQTRGSESDEDSRFVESLCRQHSIPCTIATRAKIEPDLSDAPANRSALFRACRMELFRQVCEKENLQGVILAHHSGDQAETILQRLLRGSGPSGLGGMRSRSSIYGLQVLRPLLDVPGEALRTFLREQGQAWREDASNQSNQYQRNRIRKILCDAPELAARVLELGSVCARLNEWVIGAAPVLGESFAVGELANLPTILARHAARGWLKGRGIAPDDLSPASVDRLIDMARDAATPARWDFASGVRVRRRKGIIEATKS